METSRIDELENSINNLADRLAALEDLLARTGRRLNKIDRIAALLASDDTLNDGNKSIGGSGGNWDVGDNKRREPIDLGIVTGSLAIQTDGFAIPGVGEGTPGGSLPIVNASGNTVTFWQSYSTGQLILSAPNPSASEVRAVQAIPKAPIANGGTGHFSVRPGAGVRRSIVSVVKPQARHVRAYLFVPRDGWQYVDIFHHQEPIVFETTDVGVQSADATSSGNATFRVLGEDGGFALVRV